MLSQNVKSHFILVDSFVEVFMDRLGSGRLSHLLFNLVYVMFIRCWNVKGKNADHVAKVSLDWVLKSKILSGSLFVLFRIMMFLKKLKPFIDETDFWLDFFRCSRCMNFLLFTQQLENRNIKGFVVNEVQSQGSYKLLCFVVWLHLMKFSPSFVCFLGFNLNNVHY